MNETISPTQTNHLAAQLLQDFGIEVNQLGAGELINLINLLMIFQWTRHSAQMAKDFNLDYTQSLRNDL